MKDFAARVIFLLLGFGAFYVAAQSTVNNSPVNCASNNNYATYPYPDDNTKYYLCLNNQAVVVQCNANATYQANTKSCSGGISNSPADIQCANSTNYATFPYPYDSTRYYLCINNQSSIVQCTSASVYIQEAGSCQNTNTGWYGGYFQLPSCSDQWRATYPFPGDNQRYYYCLYYQLLVVECPENEYYFQGINGCSGLYNYNNNNQYGYQTYGNQYGYQQNGYQQNGYQQYPQYGYPPYQQYPQYPQYYN